MGGVIRFPSFSIIRLAESGRNILVRAIHLRTRASGLPTRMSTSWAAFGKLSRRWQPTAASASHTVTNASGTMSDPSTTQVSAHRVPRSLHLGKTSAPCQRSSTTITIARSNTLWITCGTTLPLQALLNRWLDFSKRLRKWMQLQALNR